MNGREGNESVGEEPTEILEPGEPEDWPVTDLYRVAPEADVPDEGSTVVASETPVDPVSPRRRIPAGGAGLGIAIALALLGIGLGAWLVSRDADANAEGPTPSAQTTPATSPSSSPAPSAGKEVPDAVGLTIASARALLEGLGFAVQVRREASERPRGEVVEQEPAAGRMLRSGGTVILTVARAAEPVVVRIEVPDVVSQPVQKASQALRRAELRAEVQLVESDEKAGTVVAQEPSAGSEVGEGTVVVLSVARGAETTLVEVPSVVGSPIAEARRTLRARGFRVSATRVLDKTPAGTVVAQKPSAGSSVREGSTVRLRVSTGPRTVTVPDVVGLDEVTARSELEAAGFVVRVTEEATDDPDSDGIVLRQQPAGGMASDEGAAVTLVVGRFG